MEPGQRTHKQASLMVRVPTLGIDVNGIMEINGLQSGNPRKGHATALMHQVCAEADLSGDVLILLVEAFADGSMTEELLKKWYSRFGFKVAQKSPCLMLREPQKPMIAMVH